MSIFITTSGRGVYILGNTATSTDALMSYSRIASHKSFDLRFNLVNLDKEDDDADLRYRIEFCLEIYSS